MVTPGPEHEIAQHIWSGNRGSHRFAADCICRPQVLHTTDYGVVIWMHRGITGRFPALAAQFNAIVAAVLEEPGWDNWWRNQDQHPADEGAT